MTANWRSFYWMPMAFVTVAALAMVGGPIAAEEHDGTRWSWSDARREGAVWAALAMNPHLNPFAFSIEVNDGEAILSGTVDEDVKRDLAQEVALSVNGIDRVTNKIVVKPEYETKAESDQRTLWDATMDATTTAAVKSRLLWNRNIKGMDIDVTTHDGVTTLTGEVATEEERALAAELTQNSQGVESVNNQLMVRAGLDTDAEPPMDDIDRSYEVSRPAIDANEPIVHEGDLADSGRESTGETARESAKGFAEDVESAFSDGWIRAKVKSALMFTSGVPGTDIQVRSEEGVVHLRGVVDTDEQKSLAIATAADIKGVTSVVADDLFIAK